MRIWVARPEPGASRTAARLRERGHQPLVAPVLVIEPTRTDPPAGPFSAIVVTSAQAVPALAASSLERSHPVHAVGRQTAEAVRRAGFDDVHVARGGAADLARAIRSAIPTGAELLHVAGETRKSEPAASLCRYGYRLQTWITYAARPVAALPAEVAAALRDEDGMESLEAALHYSRRSAAIALRLCTEAGLEAAFGSLEHYCLSNDVAVPLVERGIGAHFVPAQPAEEALLDGIG